MSLLLALAFALSAYPRCSKPRRHSSLDRAQSQPRAYPTTLNIPGLTKSRISPDGKIASRDIGSKLVIVMVGLPARGKSYVTKKVARYLNWLQHDTRIFNVGERRRVAAYARPSVPYETPSDLEQLPGAALGPDGSCCTDTEVDAQRARANASKVAASILINGQAMHEDPSFDSSGGPARTPKPSPEPTSDNEPMEQNAAFFDPANSRAALLREQAAMDTLDDLLDYILDQGGSVGIFDATNSTLDRRKLVMQHIRDRAGPALNVLFIESVCDDQNLLERNMRLKLSGPDYRGKDPEKSLEDFRQRVALYEKAYIPLGKYEEDNNIPYVQMVDVGRKVISHQVRGFLSAQTVYYLLNFNLAPRQIWITRHGQSLDNISGKIGGDSDLSPAGRSYGQALARFISQQRDEWDVHEHDREAHSHLPPRPGDDTPPNPHYQSDAECSHLESKTFCVWTSMLKRSIQTAESFDDEAFDIKQMRMLDELFAGHMEGLTYDQIKEAHPDEFSRRRADKLNFRYPGPGGEGYLDVINRLRPVIVELERMTDHCLLVAHRSVARVLLAYFMGLKHNEVTDLSVPLGMLYCLEPKPYGVDLKAYQYVPEADTFEYVPDFQLTTEQVEHDSNTPKR